MAGCQRTMHLGKPKPSASATASAYLSKPKVGECHNLTFKDIAAESDTRKPVTCSSKHTTMTVAVVPAPAGASHGSEDAQAFAVGQACADGFTKAVGGDSKTRIKTLYSLAWFVPTKSQRAKGARWMRCDVTLTDQRRAYPLTGKQPLLADGPTGGEKRCGRIVGGKKTLSWEFVPCTGSHQLVPKKFVPAGSNATLKTAKAQAKAACKNGIYTWSQAEQWGIGDRWYICWGPVRGAADTGDELET